MSLAAVLNPATNLIEVYAVGADGYPYYVTQKTPGVWADAPTWHYLGPGSPLKDQPRMSSRLAAIVNQTKQTEVFAFGEGLALWHTAQTTAGKWDGDSWENLGGFGISSPSVAINSNGTLQVFGVGPSLNLNYLQQSAPGTWGNSWQSVGGQNLSDAGVGIRGSDNRLQLCTIGDNSNVYSVAQDSPGQGFGSWGSIGSLYLAAPAVVADGQGHLNVFALNEGLGLVYANLEEGGGFQSLGGTNTSDPVAALVNKNIEVYLIGDNEELYAFQQANNWKTAALGGRWIARPAVAVNANGCAELYVLGNDSVVYRLAQSTAGQWPSKPKWEHLAFAVLASSDHGSRIRGRSMGLL